MRAPPRSILRARRGFTILELILAVLIMGVMMSSGAIGVSSQVGKMRAQGEGDRLLANLHFTRELARAKAPAPQVGWNGGYGLYFWTNQNSGTCLQYAPVAMTDEVHPDSPFNVVVPFWNDGVPASNSGFLVAPVTMGEMQPVDFQKLSAGELSHGLQIIFQSDEPGVKDYSPTSVPRWPRRTRRRQFQTDRVVFWAPGYTSAPSPAWPSQLGVTLPTSRNGRHIYNRIYVLSPSDSSRGLDTGYNNPDNNPAKPVTLPVRIHIHPGTGLARIMTKYERRDDGTW